MNSLPDKDKLWVYTMALVMSFNGGYINSICLAGFLKNPVGFITGNMTLLGINLTDAAYWELGELVGLMFAFFVGCIVSGLLIKKHNFERGRCYGISLLVQIVLVSFSMIFLYFEQAQAGFFLAVALGMQNSMTTHYGTALVRTTHMTGTTTDLGVLIGHLIKGIDVETWKVKLYSILILGFIAGVVGGAFAYSQFQSFSLVLSLVVYFFMLMKRS